MEVQKIMLCTYLTPRSPEVSRKTEINQLVSTTPEEHGYTSMGKETDPPTIMKHSTRNINKYALHFNIIQIPSVMSYYSLFVIYNV